MVSRARPKTTRTPPSVSVSLVSARRSPPAGTPARAYRSWALAQPHRYRLLFGPPLPGYDAHAQRLVDAAWEAMNVLLGVLRESGDRATAPPPRPLESQLAAWAEPAGPRIAPATALRAVLIWSRCRFSRHLSSG